MEYDLIITVEFGPLNKVEFVQVQRYPTKARYITRGYDNVTDASAQRLARVCKPMTNRTVRNLGRTIRHTITA